MFILKKQFLFFLYFMLLLIYIIESYLVHEWYKNAVNNLIHSNTSNWYNLIFILRKRNQRCTRIVYFYLVFFLYVNPQRWPFIPLFAFLYCFLPVAITKCQKDSNHFIAPLRQRFQIFTWPPHLQSVKTKLLSISFSAGALHTELQED